MQHQLPHGKVSGGTFWSKTLLLIASSTLTSLAGEMTQYSLMLYVFHYFSSEEEKTKLYKFQAKQPTLEQSVDLGRKCPLKHLGDCSGDMKAKIRELTIFPASEIQIYHKYPNPNQYHISLKTKCLFVRKSNSKQSHNCSCTFSRFQHSFPK